ncbi:MAG: galE [Gemmatimonadetes bacterium]|nr:galE [Gemmatimonadota bacterium]
MQPDRARVLVTGASGFVAGAVVRRGAMDGSLAIRAATRQDGGAFPSNVERVLVDAPFEQHDWTSALADVHVVVHAAARVHIMRDSSSDALSEFRRINVEGTMNLARRAAKAGVRRLVFLSTIKVNGERTTRERPFTPDDLPAPVDPYGLSKLEAEIALRQLASDSGMEVVIIRPVLVYGPGVKGNFRSLLRWVRRGIPLPLGSIENRRSLVALDNLVDLILLSVRHPAAANQTFLVSDGNDVSTTELLYRLADAMHVSPRLFPVSERVLYWLAALVRRSGEAERVIGSLCVDIAKTRAMLGWTPPQKMDVALRQTVDELATF